MAKKRREGGPKKFNEKGKRSRALFFVGNRDVDAVVEIGDSTERGGDGRLRKGGSGSQKKSIRRLRVI